MTNVIVSVQGKSTQIIVTSLHSKADRDKFFDATTQIKNYEISFYGLRSLPQEVVIRLHHIKDLALIIVDKEILLVYLRRLGLNVQNSKPVIPSTSEKQISKVVIGGSAGGLKKVIEIIKRVPQQPLTLFIVLHQKADTPSLLSKVLQSYTKYFRVLEAQSDMRVEDATIYTIPQDKHLVVSGDYIFLTDDAKINRARPSISVTFEALSNEYKDELLAILVCGYLNDGSDVLEKLIENGSSVIVQNPKECDAKELLQNAIKTKYYNYIMDLDEIANYIKVTSVVKHIKQNQFDHFLEHVYEKYSYDFSGYQKAHMRRRLEHSYQKMNIKSFESFEREVLSHNDLFEDLFIDISINVTTFFRNPQLFLFLREEVLHKLDSYMDIKIWCAGCSSGEEPYSVAILLNELGLLDRSLIYATDINGAILQQAKNGIYSKESYNIFRTHYYLSGGERSFSSYFNDYEEFVIVSNELRKKILFFEHNLATDGSLNDFQIIFCRNVLIYFDQGLKQRALNLFDNSLTNRGFLILGESETLKDDESFEALSKENRVFRKHIK